MLWLGSSLYLLYLMVYKHSLKVELGENERKASPVILCHYGLTAALSNKVQYLINISITAPSNTWANFFSNKWPTSSDGYFLLYGPSSMCSSGKKYLTKTSRWPVGLSSNRSEFTCTYLCCFGKWHLGMQVVDSCEPRLSQNAGLEVIVACSKEAGVPSYPCTVVMTVMNWVSLLMRTCSLWIMGLTGHLCTLTRLFLVCWMKLSDSFCSSLEIMRQICSTADQFGWRASLL